MRFRSSKTVITILLIIIIISLSGCEEETTEEGKAFIGGNKGLDIEFMDGAPPEEVFDSEYPFNINLRIENVGEWDIEDSSDATVSITGIDPADFGKSHGFLTKDVDDSLTGAHRNPQGDAVRGTLTDVEFSNLEYDGSIAGNVEFIVRANVCYGYGTKVNSKICVLEDLLGVTRRVGITDVCNPNEAKDYENSGAPVHITDFKETALSNNKLSFSFKIKHVGEGAVSREGTECSDSVTDKDKVYVTVNTGISGLSCSGLNGGGSEGETTLYNGERDIICTQELPESRGNYEKQITISLEYDYEDHIDTTLKVKESID